MVKFIDKSSYLMIFMIMIIGIQGCQQDKTVSSNNISISSFDFKFQEWGIESNQIDKVLLTVSGPGMNDIIQELTVEDSSAHGIVQVLPGQDRIFRAEAFIANVIYFMGESSPLDIVAGEELIISIQMFDLCPDIQITSPADPLTVCTQNCIITWVDADYDDDALISLFYSPDTNFSGSILIEGAQGISEDDSENMFVWNTTEYDSGLVFYIFGRITDDIHPPIISRSPGTVLISHITNINTVPLIQIIQPDGINDYCDNVFEIVWYDEDPDDDAIISLFYDTDKSGQDGIPITGAQNISENDEEDSFNWNTSELTDSSEFYIYAIIDDGQNPPVLAYSNGCLIVDHSLSFTPPSAPSNLTAQASSSNQIDLHWSDNSPNELGFTIERRIEQGVFQMIAEVSPNEESYADTSLMAATTYYYQVKAFNNAGESGYSNIATASTLTPVPQTPSGLTVTPLSISSLELNWTDNSNNEEGFAIERRYGTSGVFSRIDSVQADSTTYIDLGLQAGTYYQYRIAAYNEGGESDYSAIAGASTTENVPDPPQNVVATAQSALLVSISWEDHSNNEDGFQLERSFSSSGPYSLIFTANPNQQYYLDETVEPGNIYYYQVASFNSAGQSAYAGPDSAQTPSADPIAPENLQVTGLSAYSVSLEWDDMSSNEDGFIIERQDGIVGPFFLIGQVDQNIETYTDNTVFPLSIYRFRVKAHNQWGESGYTNIAEANTPEYSPFETVLVDSGIFTMGNEPYGYGNEFHPGNPVPVTEFEIMKYPVTNLQYAIFLDEMYDAEAIVVYQGLVYNQDTSLVYMSLSNEDCQIDFDGDNFASEPLYQNYPVMLVSWNGADAFAEYYDVDLPTEAQWEKTARGTLGPDTNFDGVGDGYKYPWGSNIDGSYANYLNSGDPWELGDFPYTSPVGAFDGTNYSGFQTNDNACVYGAYDLCGNVMEWTDDWYASYQDPHQPPISGILKVVRGGSWASSTYFCRNAYRQAYDPTDRFNNVGFRCVKND